jgi:biotin carboxyl carrier protein
MDGAAGGIGRGVVMPVATDRGDDAQRSSVEFTITLDDVKYPVVVDGDRVTINGRPFTVEVGEENRVLVDGIAHDVTLDGDTAHVDDASYTMEVTGLSLGRAAPPMAAPTALAEVEAGAGAVVAIMPGKITRVMVLEGQQVQQGEAVCVLEAMKMENELRAEQDGVVKGVYVKPGDDVEKDQVLVELDAR